MFQLIKRREASVFSKIISGVICFTFVFSLITPAGYAQNIVNLPVPGTMVSTSPAFTPVLMKGLTINPDDALQFDFLIDEGDIPFEQAAFKEESEKLIKYFLAALTVPDDQQWVNLSPHEQDRIIEEEFSQTEMGHDMLAQDYLLKQLTASLIYPENELGQTFWNKVKAKAKKLYGTDDIPMNTFNKVWIMPEKALVFERNNTAVVADARLKVMLEEDYVALDKNAANKVFGTSDALKQNKDKISTVTSHVIREVIIPAIEQEINEGENFAPLRQIYHSVILAHWYKTNLKDSVLTQGYADQNRVNGIDLAEPGTKDKIYQKYLEAYRKGVYNFIKEDYNPRTNKPMPRKYFSGGADYALLGIAEVTDNQVALNGFDSDTGLHGVRARVDMATLTQTGRQSLTRSLTRNAGEYAFGAAEKNLKEALPRMSTKDAETILAGLAQAKDREAGGRRDRDLKVAEALLRQKAGIDRATLTEPQTDAATLPSSDIKGRFMAGEKSVLLSVRFSDEDDDGVGFPYATFFIVVEVDNVSTGFSLAPIRREVSSRDLFMALKSFIMASGNSFETAQKISGNIRSDFLNSRWGADFNVALFDLSGRQSQMRFLRGGGAHEIAQVVSAQVDALLHGKGDTVYFVYPQPTAEGTHSVLGTGVLESQLRRYKAELEAADSILIVAADDRSSALILPLSGVSPDSEVNPWAQLNTSLLQNQLGLTPTEVDLLMSSLSVYTNRKGIGVLPGIQIAVLIQAILNRNSLESLQSIAERLRDHLNQRHPRLSRLGLERFYPRYYQLLNIIGKIEEQSKLLTAMAETLAGLTFVLDFPASTTAGETQFPGGTLEIRSVIRDGKIAMRASGLGEEPVLVDRGGEERVPLGLVAVTPQELALEEFQSADELLATFKRALVRAGVSYRHVTEIRGEGAAALGFEARQPFADSAMGVDLDRNWTSSFTMRGHREVIMVSVGEGEQEQRRLLILENNTLEGFERNPILGFAFGDVTGEISSPFNSHRFNRWTDLRRVQLANELFEVRQDGIGRMSFRALTDEPVRLDFVQEYSGPLFLTDNLRFEFAVSDDGLPNTIVLDPHGRNRTELFISAATGGSTYRLVQGGEETSGRLEAGEERALSIKVGRSEVTVVRDQMRPAVRVQIVEGAIPVNIETDMTRHPSSMVWIMSGERAIPFRFSDANAARMVLERTVRFQRGGEDTRVVVNGQTLDVGWEEARESSYRKYFRVLERREQTYFFERGISRAEVPIGDSRYLVLVQPAPDGGPTTALMSFYNMGIPAGTDPAELTETQALGDVAMNTLEAPEVFRLDLSKVERLGIGPSNVLFEELPILGEGDELGDQLTKILAAAQWREEDLIEGVKKGAIDLKIAFMSIGGADDQVVVLLGIVFEPKLDGDTRILLLGPEEIYGKAREWGDLKVANGRSVFIDGKQPTLEVETVMRREDQVLFVTMNPKADGAMTELDVSSGEVSIDGWKNEHVEAFRLAGESVTIGLNNSGVLYVYPMGDALIFPHTEDREVFVGGGIYRFRTSQRPRQATATTAGGTETVLEYERVREEEVGEEFVASVSGHSYTSTYYPGRKFERLKTPKRTLLNTDGTVREQRLAIKKDVPDDDGVEGITTLVTRRQEDGHVLRMEIFPGNTVPDARDQYLAEVGVDISEGSSEPIELQVNGVNVSVSLGEPIAGAERWMLNFLGSPRPAQEITGEIINNIGGASYRVEIRDDRVYFTREGSNQPGPDGAMAGESGAFRVSVQESLLNDKPYFTGGGVQIRMIEEGNNLGLRISGSTGRILIGDGQVITGVRVGDQTYEVSREGSASYVIFTPEASGDGAMEGSSEENSFAAARRRLEDAEAATGENRRLERQDRPLAPSSPAADAHRRLRFAEEAMGEDRASLTHGGVDFTAERQNVQVDRQGPGIKFNVQNIDPAMFSNGVVPVIEYITPKPVNVMMILGLMDEENGSDRVDVYGRDPVDLES